MQQILNSDTQRIFNDWGIEATLEEVESYYDPDTARMEESVATSPLTVLPGLSVGLSSSESSARDILHEAQFLVRLDDLPDQWNLDNSRILVGDSSYRIESSTHSMLSNTILLQCVMCSLR